jgi:hypothetical protein
VYFCRLKKYWLVKTTSYNGKYSTTTCTYFYEDILGAKTDAQGNFLWLRKIPNKQPSIDADQTLGYKLVSDETGYCFLYPDNKKNVDLEQVK